MDKLTYAILTFHKSTEGGQVRRFVLWHVLDSSFGLLDFQTFGLRWSSGHMDFLDLDLDLGFGLLDFLTFGLQVQGHGAGSFRFFGLGLGLGLGIWTF